MLKANNNSGKNGVTIRNGNTGGKAGKPTQTVTHNPFGQQKTSKTALQLLQESFVIGVRDFDYGVDRWNPLRRDEATGKLSPGFQHVPNLVLEVVIEFATNEGKGTGRQSIPAREFPEYVKALREIHENGYNARPEADRTVYVPTYDVARESFTMIGAKKTVSDGKGGTKTVVDPDAPRDIVSVRCVSGKGAKPMTVHKSEFLGIVQALESIAADLADHEALAWAGYDAKIDSGEISMPDNYPVSRLQTSEEEVVDTDEDSDGVEPLIDAGDDSDADASDLEDTVPESPEGDLAASGLDDSVADEDIDFGSDEDSDE